MEIKLLETNNEQLNALEESLEKKENQEMNEETFIEIAKGTNMSFSIEECSRLISHHVCESLDSYTQQSQRYVKLGEKAFIIPEEIKEMGKETEEEYKELNKELFEFYNKITQLKEGFAGRKATESDYKYGIKIEDGRYILPLSTTTNVFTTMNFSKITNFFKTMKRIKIKESEELIKKLGEEIEKKTGKKSQLLTLINSFSKQGEIEEKKTTEHYKKLFEKINEINNCVLINKFEKPIQRTGLGAITSTNEKPPSEVLKEWENEEEKAKGITERVLGYGHTSIIEHARTTFGLMMTLTCYHQFERHRLPSNIRERLEDIPIGRNILIPESVKKNSAILKEFIEKIEKTKQFRKILLEKNGIKTQPYLLLNADRVKVINSTNARMDKEIMNERLCNNAQWEIRKLYEKKLEQLRKIDPTIYGKIGPGCTRGACPEGSLSCGKMREMQEKYAKQKTS